MTGQSGEALRLISDYIALPCLARYRRGERMFALAFERSCEFQQRIIIKSVGRHDIGDLRLALSQRSGLVEDDYLSFSGSVQARSQS